MKIKELLEKKEFKNKKVLKNLIGYFCGLNSLEIEQNKEDIVEKDKIEAIIYEYCKFFQKPLYRIMGKGKFYGLDFTITKDTFGLMTSTERMIDPINKIISNKKNINLFDIGTGSGALGITLAYHNLSKIQNLFLSDISKEALEIAEKNCDNILKKKTIKEKIIKSNLIDFWFRSNLVKKELNKKNIYNVVVANLPFQRNDELKTSQFARNLLKENPKIALLAGKDGTFYYKNLLKKFLKFNKENGTKNIIMFFQMLYWQLDILRSIFDSYFYFENVLYLNGDIILVKCYLKTANNP